MKTIFLLILIFIILTSPANADILILNNDTTNSFTNSTNLNGSSWTGQNGGGLRINRNLSYLDGLIGSYNLDESVGTYIHNVNNNSGFINLTNQGTWVGFTKVNSTTGTIGNASIFDGVNDYVSIPNWDSIGWEVPGGFTNTGLAYDDTDGTLWIGDFDNSRIVHTDKNGVFLGSFTVGCNPGSGLQGVTVNRSNNTLMYSCFDTYKVGEITKAGAEVKFYFVGSANNVNHIALNKDSSVLYVVRNNANITKHYPQNGTQFGYFNVTGYNAFDGISYDLTDDTIWLTKDPSTVLNVDLSGNVLSIFTEAFDSMEGITQNTTENTLFLGSDALYHQGIANGNRVYNISKAGRVINVNSQFTSKITISVWVKPTSITNVNKGIVAKRTGIANSWQFILGTLSKPTFRVYNASTNQEVVANYPVVDPNLWYNLVATYNGSKIIVYINGRLNNSGNYFGGDINYSSSIIQIGAFFSATGNNFNGSIDEVNVWNRTLSAEEISVLYNTSLRSKAMPIFNNKGAISNHVFNRTKIQFTGQDNLNNITLNVRKNGTLGWVTLQPNVSNNTWVDIPSEMQVNNLDFGLEMNGNESNTIFFISMELDQTPIPIIPTPVPGCGVHTILNNSNLAPTIHPSVPGTGERINGTTYYANESEIDLHVFAHANTAAQTAGTFVYINNTLVCPRSGRPLGGAEEAYRGCDISIPKGAYYRVEFFNYHHYEWREYKTDLDISGCNYPNDNDSLNSVILTFSFGVGFMIALIVCFVVFKKSVEEHERRYHRGK